MDIENYEKVRGNPHLMHPSAFNNGVFITLV